MGSIPQELSLDYRHTLASAEPDVDVASAENTFPKTITKFMEEVSMMGHVSEKLSKLDDYVRRLEEEMRKIEVFKRELPLCMLLLTDAILALKQESSKLYVKPILEEFMPLKKKNSSEDELDREETREMDLLDKKNWMSSVQLWSSSDNEPLEADLSYKRISEQENKKRILEEEDQAKSEDFFKSDTSHSSVWKVSSPQKCSDLSLILERKEDNEKLPLVPAISFQTLVTKKLKEEVGCVGISSTATGNRIVSSPVNNSGQRAVTQSQCQTSRKQRRCWSPELHRQFVDALQRLGGCQAATPKQIRDLMQVDGLTNDEVKSHLQKYRLHTRRIPGSTNTPSSNQSDIVLGGLWMTPKHCGVVSKQSTSKSTSPQSHFQLGGASMGTSMSGSDSMEEEEEEKDEKSEGHSWKSHAITCIQNVIQVPRFAG